MFNKLFGVLWVLVCNPFIFTMRRISYHVDRIYDREAKFLFLLFIMKILVMLKQPTKKNKTINHLKTALILKCQSCFFM